MSTMSTTASRIVQQTNYYEQGVVGKPTTLFCKYNSSLLNIISKSIISMALTKGNNDEFYTLYSDIESEIEHYKDKLRGKVVYCNCDNPDKSNFALYFRRNFSNIGMKGLWCTYLCDWGDSVALHIKEDGTEERIELNWDGSFESHECVEIMKMCDIVVTNPPFSLFRAFIDLVLSLKKDYILVGNQNIITYEPVFNEFKEGRAKYGYGYKGMIGYFINEFYEDYAVAGEHREGQIRVSGVCWITNMRDDVPQPIKLTCKYEPDLYPRYDTFDAIDVDKVSRIPYDYDGLMGVPITFFSKYNPEQFEVIGLDKTMPDNETGGRFELDGGTKYARVVIKHRKSF